MYARTILGLPIRDVTGGFKCYKRRVLESFDLNAICSNGYSFQIETTYRAHKNGFSIREIPITFIERRAGRSKFSKKIILEAIGIVWRLKFER